MKIKKEKLKQILKEEIQEAFVNTSLMEDMFTEEEKEHWLREFQKSKEFPEYELDSDVPKDEEPEKEAGLASKESFVNAALLADATDYERDAVLTEHEKELNKSVMAMISGAEWIEVETEEEKIKLAEEFYSSVSSNPRVEFLTLYSINDLMGMSLYKLPGYKIGFAIKSDGDIVSVHNSEGSVRGIGKALVVAAMKKGGTKLDHFDGFLSPFYNSLGFKEYDRWKWDDQYAPKGWDYDAYGTPDVVLRKL